jgi:hypothetical protein
VHDCLAMPLSTVPSESAETIECLMRQGLVI